MYGCGVSVREDEGALRREGGGDCASVNVLRAIQLCTEKGWNQ